MGEPIKAILDFAMMAKAAYENETAIREKYGSQYRIIVKDTPNCQGQCVLFFDDINMVQYIASRGSKTPENFLKDAEYLKEPDAKTGIVLHQGFRESALETYNYIVPELHKNYQTLLTGHSLGGAIAVILHLYLLADDFMVNKTITFGQPKITNKDGVNKYRDIPLLRIINKKDLVPLVPPLSIVSCEHGPYHHFGPETLLLNGCYLCNLDEHNAEAWNATNFWEDLVKGQADIHDHFMEAYIENLECKTENSQEIPFARRGEYL